MAEWIPWFDLEWRLKPKLKKVLMDCWETVSMEIYGMSLVSDDDF